MIHPDTELRHISAEVGYGVYAKTLIPAGTITYIKDSLEIIISESDYHLHNAAMRGQIDRFSYRDEKGDRIVSWDFAKYVNHSCSPNSMSTGYGFEIALRDIQPGEELTDEYGIFNLDSDMDCSCGSPHCRKVIRASDFDHYYQEWDNRIKSILPKTLEMSQALWPFLDPGTQMALEAYRLDQSNRYRSVYSLRFQHELQPSSNHRR